MTRFCRVSGPMTGVTAGADRSDDWRPARTKHRADPRSLGAGTAGYAYHRKITTGHCDLGERVASPRSVKRANRFSYLGKAISVVFAAIDPLTKRQHPSANQMNYWHRVT